MSRYPLSVPLALRTLDGEHAKAALGEALVREAARERERDELAARAAFAAGRWRAAIRSLAAEWASGGLPGRARFAGRLRAEAERRAGALRAAEEALAAARAEVEERRVRLAAVRSASKGLERHRDGWLAARRRESLRREQGELDDAVSGRRGEA